MLVGLMIRRLQVRGLPPFARTQAYIVLPRVTPSILGLPPRRNKTASAGEAGRRFMSHYFSDCVRLATPHTRSRANLVVSSATELLWVRPIDIPVPPFCCRQRAPSCDVFGFLRLGGGFASGALALARRDNPRLDHDPSTPSQDLSTKQERRVEIVPKGRSVAKVRIPWLNDGVSQT